MSKLAASGAWRNLQLPTSKKWMSTELERPKCVKCYSLRPKTYKEIYGKEITIGKYAFTHGLR